MQVQVIVDRILAEALLGHADIHLAVLVEVPQRAGTETFAAGIIPRRGMGEVARKALAPGRADPGRAGGQVLDGQVSTLMCRGL